MLHRADTPFTAAAVYDFVLTFSDEIRFIWRRQITGAKILFLLNRYVFIAYTVTEVISGFPTEVSTAVVIVA